MFLTGVQNGREEELEAVSDGGCIEGGRVEARAGHGGDELHELQQHHQQGLRQRVPAPVEHLDGVVCQLLAHLAGHLDQG